MLFLDTSVTARAYSSVLLVHLKGGRPEDARVMISYTSVVLGYGRSCGYDRALRCDRGRRQMVTAISVRHNNCVAVTAFPHVGVQCRSSCKDVSILTVPGSGHFS